jgi:hypothetical protein
MRIIMALSKLAKKYTALLEAAESFAAVMDVERQVSEDSEYASGTTAAEKQALSKLFGERASALTGVASKVETFPDADVQPLKSERLERMERMLAERRKGARR